MLWNPLMVNGALDLASVGGLAWWNKFGQDRYLLCDSCDFNWNHYLCWKFQVAFAAAGFTFTADRMSAVNFSMSLDAQPYTFMFARPKQLSRAYLFIQPYTPNVTSWRNNKWRKFISSYFYNRLGLQFLPWQLAQVHWSGPSIISPRFMTSTLIVQDRQFLASGIIFGIVSARCFFRVIT
jgi:hypothetical protein